MKKHVILTFGIVALLGLVGCQKQQPGAGPPPTARASSVSGKTAPAPLPPVSDKGTTPAQIVAAGLIPPVTSQQRLRQVERGRANPFEPLELQVIAPAVKPLSQKPPMPVSLPPTSRPVAAPPPARNGSLPPPNIAPPTQVIPAPVEAQGVYVTGIIDLGHSPLAIVQVQGETSEQSVRVGSRLSGGLVTVVAVDAQAQTVVLEQYGQLVTRKLGDAPQGIAPPTLPPAVSSVIAPPTLPGLSVAPQQAIVQTSVSLYQRLLDLPREPGE